VAATNGQVSLTGDPEPSHKRHWWRVPTPN